MGEELRQTNKYVPSSNSIILCFENGDPLEMGRCRRKNHHTETAEMFLSDKPGHHMAESMINDN